MNWEAIGAIGELAGALAVVLSLGYLALQIRENTRALRRTASAAAVEGVREWSHRLIDDASANLLFRKGLEGMDALSEEERARFVPLMFNFMKTFEHLHYEYTQDALAPDVWAGWEYVARGYLTSPGAGDYYAERRPCFNPRFQEWVEGLDRAPEFKHLGELAAPQRDPE